MTKANATFPEWIRRAWPSGEAVSEMKRLLGGLHLHTVCQSAHCPNQAECWSRRTATLMVMGNRCTRNCAFCAVNTGRPEPLDPEEPQNVAEAIRRLGLRHAVITSVTRDDLPDGGAAHIARTIETVKAVNPDTTIEVLVPDFGGSVQAVEVVLAAGPEVFAHNLETVEALHPVLRDPRAAYARSLAVLRVAATHPGQRFVKSGLMLGCGETPAQVREAVEALRATGCTVLSIGQYLQPTPKHYPVKTYVTPEQFAEYEALAYALGFEFAVAGPFVRSSYQSEALMHTPEAQRRVSAEGMVGPCS
jgi:lipoic acid synthetase